MLLSLVFLKEKKNSGNHELGNLFGALFCGPRASCTSGLKGRAGDSNPCPCSTAQAMWRLVSAWMRLLPLLWTST